MEINELREQFKNAEAKEAEIKARIDEAVASREEGDEPEEEAADEGEDLSKLSVADLKERLKAAGLPVSGKKADLIARLSQEEE